jgi:hypothetical protein
MLFAGQQATQGSSGAWSGARQANAHARDFTVNSLMYDPFGSVLYDYTGESGSVLVVCHMRQFASDFGLVCTGSVCTVSSITRFGRWGGRLQEQDAARSGRS